MNRLFGWWLRIPRRIRMTVLTLATLAALGYMVFLGGRSMLDDPNWDTLWLSVIGAALLTFITYKATKK
ncbi:membrane protein [Exiguobacterium mexicanum]|nr:membrane protein [Exiguobacterium mexicanum]